MASSVAGGAGRERGGQERERERKRGAGVEGDGGASPAEGVNNAAVILVSQDGQQLAIDHQCAQQVGILRGLLERGEDERGGSENGRERERGAVPSVPLPAVKGSILVKIVEFLHQHRKDTLWTAEISSKASAKRKNGDMADVKADDAKNIDDDDEDDEDDEECRNETAAVSGLRIESRMGSSEENDNNDDSSDGEHDSYEEEYLHEDCFSTLTPWDQHYLNTLDLPALLELTKAANYLYIPTLLDICCRALAKQMTGLKAEELRKKFNLPNDFTPEEEAKLAAEFAWIEE